MATNMPNTQRMAGNVVVREEEDIGDIDPTSISRSVFVTGFQATTKPEDLIIHFQRNKNGGGDINNITISKKGTAVIAFDNPEVASSVVQHKQEFGGVVLTVEPFLDAMVGNNDQPLEVFELVSAELCLEVVEYLSREQTKALLEDIKNKTGVQWFESAEKLMMSGTFQQMEDSRAFLQQGVNQSNHGIVVSNDLKRIEVASQKRENNESSFHDEAENQEDVNQNNPRERTNDVTGTGRKASSTAITIESFEIEPKIVKVFVKAHGKELEDIESKCHVEIPRKAEGSKLCIKPKYECSADDYEEACNQFITLYQKAYLLIRMERFSLKSEAKVIQARKVISRMDKNFPISVERSKDQNHWELYGEASHIEEALEYLKQQGVEIEREKENPVAKNGRRKKPEDNEDAMDVDPPEYSKGGKNPDDRLETFLGKVKVSVYKGDITNERVDVIVNAANKNLDHDGGVAKAILDKGGKAIKKESLEIIKKRRELKDGDAVATSSGRLPCKVVVHAVGPKWYDVGSTNSRKLLHRACLNSLCETEKRNMTSIALPAIGSGIYGMPKDVCAEVMFDAVEEFVRQGDAKKKKITDIRFVNIDDPSVQAFSKEFNSRYGNDRERSSSKKASGGGTASLSPTGAEGGGLTLPSSTSNHGRGQNRNEPDNSRPTNPNDAGDYQHHPTYFDDPLSSSSHFSSANASYSSAVKRNAGDHDKRHPMPQSHEGKGGFSLPPNGGDGGKIDKKEEENCPICLDTMTNPRALSCKHVFCSGCLQTALDVCNKCPVCQEPQGALKGNQPRGEMTFRVDHYSVPGYGGCRTIVIDYHFPSGVQGREHPNPGQRYYGTSRTGYLPDTLEGREVLHLLRRAFDARLVFTVGTSNTTGISNQVIWNDIHHKTNVYGSTYGFGYPDPDYLRRVKEELAAKGIR